MKVGLEHRNTSFIGKKMTFRNIYPQILSKIITYTLLLSFHQAHSSFFFLIQVSKVSCSSFCTFLCDVWLILADAGFKILVTHILEYWAKSKGLHVNIYRYTIKDDRETSKNSVI